MAKKTILLALIAASAACSSVIDDGSAPAVEPVQEDALVMNWHDASEPPPADHVYEEASDGCIRGVVWAESLSPEQVAQGWCVETLVVRVPRGGRFLMPTLEEVRGDLRIIGGGAEYIRLPGIKRVYGDILIESSGRNESHPAIANAIDLSGLRIVDKGIFLSEGSLGEMHIAGLETVGTDFSTHSVRDLNELRLPNLVTVGAELVVTDTSLELLWAPRLENAAQIVAQDNPNLSQCDVEDLANESESMLSAANNGAC